jgi:hypothetical protein
VCCGLTQLEDVVALMPIGPGDDADARSHARRGEPYTPRVVAVCRACAFGEELDQTKTDTKPAGGDPPA